MLIQFHLNLKLTLFSGLFFPLLLSLGFWQVDRADQKEGILDAFDHQKNKKHTALNVHAAELLVDYQSVELSGAYVSERYWLLEGRTQKSVPGYHVLMPFVLSDNNVVIVDRGWLPANPDRSILPKFDTPRLTLNIMGSIQPVSDIAFVDETENTLVVWPHRILEVDIEIMSSQFGSALFSKVIRLDETEPSAFSIINRPVNMTPQKHIGYAVQWFSLALALAVLWLFASSNIADVLRKIITKNEDV